MAAHSNTSPSPLSSRPIFANSQVSSAPRRRSFTGNKTSVLTSSGHSDSFRTANTPSDFARTPSIGKEGRGSYSKDWDEKENNEMVHISKAYKFHSPAKSCKNFMAPTISAASKFTPSPRKRVLMERNDPVRTSNSISDRKAVLSCTVSEDLEPKSKLAARDGFPVSRHSKRVTFSDICSESLLESAITESGSVKIDSGLRNKTCGLLDSPSIAPIDADPSMPLDGPITVYSLHYKPNPKMEILLNKEKEVDKDEFKWLESNIMLDILSENFSNCEDTNEEPYTEEVPASADMVIGATEEETEFNPHIVEPSEALTANKTAAGPIHEKNLVQENYKKPRPLSRLWRFWVLMIFLVACGSIYFARSPGLDELDVKDSSFSNLNNFYNQSRIVAWTKVHFDSVVKHVSQFSAPSMSFVISKLEEGEKLGQFPFVNLSDMKLYSWNEGHFLVTGISEELEEDLEEDELEDAYEEDEPGENLEGELETKANEVVETEVVLCLDSVKVAELEKNYAAADQENPLEEEVVEIPPATAVNDRGNGLEEVTVEGLSNGTGIVKSSDGIDDCSSPCQRSSSGIDSSSGGSVERCLLMKEEDSAPSKDKFPAHYAKEVLVFSLFTAALIASAAAYVCHHRYKTTTAHPINVQTLSKNCWPSRGFQWRGGRGYYPCQAFKQIQISSSSDH